MIIPLHAACWGARHTFTLLVFIGYTLCHATRVDMSVAVVSMVGSAPGEWMDGWMNIEYVWTLSKSVKMLNLHLNKESSQSNLLQ